MALDAGAWALEHLPETGTVGVFHTPTSRTRQTAEGLVLSLGQRASLQVIDVLPETFPDLDMLADRLSGARPGWPVPALPPTVLVGHHTTLVALSRELPVDEKRPKPSNYTAGMCLVRDRTRACGWRVEAICSGRPAGR
jgi:phosphohistidine phosphatase SixA